MRIKGMINTEYDDSSIIIPSTNDGLSTHASTLEVRREKKYRKYGISIVHIRKARENMMPVKTCMIISIFLFMNPISLAIVRKNIGILWDADCRIWVIWQ